MPTVLSNAGPLMALGKLNRLDLLTELYEQVQIPRAVYTETVSRSQIPFGNDFRNAPRCQSKMIDNHCVW
jgi:predicted nucleic acid-binding protein